ncbi:hypothetical protein DSM112329_01893 [Paraconexibacter sp. AEG42_29]|uniref:Methyltransferase domain-containing protein n=1 Tax=Paraconexibacter sp. AEG42_29 TaxID=2997339 RepID=A0AAU7AU99_9ACTN
MSLPPEHFEALYRADPDPWAFATSDYESAKYRRTVEALEDRRYPRALELGCSIGVLTRQLAGLCDVLVACDAAPTAVAAAFSRVEDLDHVDVTTAVLPELPAGRWDLVVASEVLYYLDDEALDRTLDAIESVLVPGGRLLAVHWTQPTRTYPQQGDDVHAAIERRPALTLEHGERHESYRLDRFTRR